DGNKADAEILVEVLVGGGVTAAALQAHFHIELAPFADRGDVNVLVEHFHVAVGLDHAAGDDARLVGPQIDRLRRISRQLERNLFQVEDDVGRVLHHTGDRLK